MLKRFLVVQQLLGLKLSIPEPAPEPLPEQPEPDYPEPDYPVPEQPPGQTGTETLAVGGKAFGRRELQGWTALPLHHRHHQ